MLVKLAYSRSSKGGIMVGTIKEKLTFDEGKEVSGDLVRESHWLSIRFEGIKPGIKMPSRAVLEVRGDLDSDKDYLIERPKLVVDDFMVTYESSDFMLGIVCDEGNLEEVISKISFIRLYPFKKALGPEIIFCHN